MVPVVLVPACPRELRSHPGRTQQPRISHVSQKGTGSIFSKRDRASGNAYPTPLKAEEPKIRERAICVQ